MASTKILLMCALRNCHIGDDIRCLIHFVKKRNNFFGRQRRHKMVFLFLLLASTLTSQLHIERSICVKERSSDFWDYIVNRTFNQNDWYENFRMGKETFEYLCNELKVYIEKKDTWLHQAIPVKLRLAITVWLLNIAYLAVFLVFQDHPFAAL